MRLAVTVENETLDDLLNRVYAFEPKPSTAVIQAARKALTEANPYLGRMDEVPPGTIVAVPHLEGAAPSAQTQDAEPMIGGVAVEQLRGAVALAGQRLADDVDAELADARDTAKLTSSSELRELGRASPLLKEELPKLARAASSRAESALELQSYQKRAFAQLQKDLESLVSAFGSSR